MDGCCNDVNDGMMGLSPWVRNMQWEAKKCYILLPLSLVKPTRRRHVPGIIPGWSNESGCRGRTSTSSYSQYHGALSSAIDSLWMNIFKLPMRDSYQVAGT